MRLRRRLLAHQTGLGLGQAPCGERAQLGIRGIAQPRVVVEPVPVEEDVDVGQLPVRREESEQVARIRGKDVAEIRG